LKPTAGEIAAATHSRQGAGMLLRSRSSIWAMRYSGSPRKLPAMPLAIWSLRAGGVFSPAISQARLPAKVSAEASQ
jgi:hypothetical protein